MSLTHGKAFPNSINVNNSLAAFDFSRLFINHLNKFYLPSHSDMIFLCIGTDRSTGDSLGPLVGCKLKNSLSRHDRIHVYGTLQDPVHAKNLEENLSMIKTNYENPFIIAIDACLGRLDKVGYITIGQGSLKPGAGVKKDLPPVGNLHIMGIVNLSGYMEYMILQSTRLHLVMKIASAISEGIRFSLWKLNKEKLLS